MVGAAFLTKVVGRREEGYIPARGFGSEAVVALGAGGRTISLDAAGVMRVEAEGLWVRRVGKVASASGATGLYRMGRPFSDRRMSRGHRKKAKKVSVTRITQDGQSVVRLGLTIVLFIVACTSALNSCLRMSTAA